MAVPLEVVEALIAQEQDGTAAVAPVSIEAEAQVSTAAEAPAEIAVEAMAATPVAAGALAEAQV